VEKKRYLFSFWHGYNKTGMEVVDVSEQVSFSSSFFFFSFFLLEKEENERHGL